MGWFERTHLSEVRLVFFSRPLPSPMAPLAPIWLRNSLRKDARLMDQKHSKNKGTPTEGYSLERLLWVGLRVLPRAWSERRCIVTHFNVMSDVCAASACPRDWPCSGSRPQFCKLHVRSKTNKSPSSHRHLWAGMMQQISAVASHTHTRKNSTHLRTLSPSNRVSSSGTAA